MLFPKINFARSEEPIKSEFDNYIKNVESFLEECTDEIQRIKFLASYLS
jgi:hypothetical protein